MLLPEAKTYADLRDGFEWSIPERFNIGTAVSDAWAERAPDREALVFASEDGSATAYTYGDLRDLSNKFANLLADRGIKPGDRVGVLLPQSLETAIAHIAALKLGAITIPLFTLFGDEALAYRLGNADAKCVVTDAAGTAKIDRIRSSLPALTCVLSTQSGAQDAEDLWEQLNIRSSDFTPRNTHAEDPAILIYTSGTTGQPKGALHAHRVLPGHLPGVAMSHNFLGQPGDRIWTPADWAWIGGLLDVLLPGLYLGVPVVACRFRKFSAEAAFQLLQDQKIRNTFLPPTALKMMRQLSEPEKKWQFHLRSIASGGETLGAELIEWGRRTFGLTINEFYGQTECNMIVSSCNAIMEVRPGVMGRPVPGHQVTVVNDQGEELPDETLGNIAVRRPDPVMFLGYWNKPEATEAKFAGDWLLTGDTGMRCADGRLRFVGRDDDVITSSGYRIGPGEIEDCLIKHPSVAMAGVIGKPDSVRTEIVKAYIVLKTGVSASADLSDEIAEFVKTRLAAHEYPREIAFVDALPLTVTGKVIRRDLRARAEQEG